MDNQPHSPNQNDLYLPIVKNKTQIHDTIRREQVTIALRTVALIFVHGFVTSMIQVAAILDFVPETQLVVVTLILLASIPVGVLADDFFKGLLIAFGSYAIWLISTILFLSLPAMLGVVESPDLFVIHYISYTVTFLLFIPAPLLFGIGLGSLMSEFL